MRAGVIAAVLTIGLGAVAANAAPSPGPCRTERGKVFFANGTPSLRISPNGSRRIYGVVGQNGAGEFAQSDLPPALASLPSQALWETRVTADLTICPLTPPRPGVMQRMTLKDARNVTVHAKPQMSR